MVSAAKYALALTVAVLLSSVPLLAISSESNSVLTPAITIHSEEHPDNILLAEISGFIEKPFSQLSEALTIPENWCDFVPLTLNVKACTASYEMESAFLTFFLGRKIYQPPVDAHPMKYQFRVEEANDRFFKIILMAAKGPLGTRDYIIELEGKRSFNGTDLFFRSSYRESIRSKIAAQGYLKTAGRKKVGFSEIGRHENGETIYVNGIQGALERNAVRYYLALQAYLETTQLEPEKRFEERIRHWFELTENFHLQLHELGREEYLQAKRRERQNQILLQELHGDGDLS